MKRIAPLGVIALLAASCFSFDDVSNKTESVIQVRNEPESAQEYEQFLNDMFNGGMDTVAVYPVVRFGPIYHYAKVAEDDETLLGGFAFCIGHDPVTAPDRHPARLTVCDKAGNNGSYAYAVYHDTIPPLMPDHAIQVYIPNDESSCTPVGVFVQNTHAVVEAVKYGIGLADGPFRDGDYLDVTFRASKKEAAAGEKTFRLVDGTKLLDGWTKVDLSDFQSMDTMEISLASSRPDMPLYVCIDDFVYHYIEIY